MFGKMAIASISAFAPIYAVIAVVSAIALVLEDIYYYFKGWDSVTGNLVKKFPILEGVLNVIKPVVMGIFETFDKILGFIKEPSWENFKNIFKTIGNLLVSAINAPLELIIKGIGKLQSLFPTLAPLLEPLKYIVEAIKDAFNYVIDLISNLSFEKILGDLANLKDMISQGIGNFFQSLNPFSNNEKTQIGNNERTQIEQQSLQDTPMIPSQSNLNNSNTYNINQNINQNITSATPKALADSTNQMMINSVNAMRQQRGAL